MKLKLLFLPLAFLLIQSCTKEKNELMEPNISPTNIAVKKIDMSDIETNYDTYVSELQSNPNLDITFGEFELKLREMKPAIGINVENTTILEDKMDNNTIIIDNSTQSIYVRSINTEEKYSYVLFAAKDASKIKDVFKLDDYNVEAIINSNSYQNSLNTSAEIGFVSNDNSFIIRKPILTSKEELLNVTEFGTSYEVGKDENHTQCHHSSYPLAPIKGANHTKKRLPVKLVYVDEFDRIDKAFYREKQIQGWSRKKKEALIQGMPEKLNELARCLNESSHLNHGGFDSAQPPTSDTD